MTRVDLHCHSTASPDATTPPDEVYALAKSRGMDFVTLTDHDAIDGAVELADRHEDAFVSVELTCAFRGEPQRVHVLCWGLTPEDFEILRRLSVDVDDVAAYLADREIANALAHPFFTVAAPLGARHRRRLARLFPAWETRNGARAPELNAPARTWADTHGATAVAGSDDHAGIDVGRTYTETPPAADWREYLAHVRGGRTDARGAQGSAAKWAHAAVAIAVRRHGAAAVAIPPDPAAVWQMVGSLLGDGEARRGMVGAALDPEHVRALAAAWLDAVELDGPGLLRLFRTDSDVHANLARRARRVHERRLRDAVGRVAADPLDLGALGAVFDACIPALPYAPAAAFLGRERRRLRHEDPDAPVRVALVADGIGAVHGVTRTVEVIRELGVPDFEVEVVGTDPGVDRRLGTVADVDLGGVSVGVPALPTVVEALAGGGYDLVHVCSPGPVGVLAALVAKVMGLPLTGSYHTELAAYAGIRSGEEQLAAGVAAVVGRFYGACDKVLSPSLSADAALRAAGVAADRLHRWDRGVDAARFAAARRAEGPGGRRHLNVLYAGRLDPEKGIDLLAEAFDRAQVVEPRLHLVVAGSGPDEPTLRRRLGKHVTFLGWLEPPALARAYARADLFCFCSRTDTFGQVVLEAQASGLPVVAVRAGGPAELVEDGRSGVLCPPDPDAIAAALVRLARSPALRDRLSRGGLAAVQERTWARSMSRLAASWHAALQTRTEGDVVGRAA